MLKALSLAIIRATPPLAMSLRNKRAKHCKCLDAVLLYHLYEAVVV